jgi:3-hydroxyisobutyrate dehydrogenase-like beta-hydroxyacid dehydrogenase
MNGRPVGLVGVGLVGAALAERFLAAGFDVIGFDRDPERCRLLARLGGQAATSVGDVGSSCQRVVLSLPDSAAVEAVVAEFAAGRPDDLQIIDTTTGDPHRTAALGEKLQQQGIQYLDATITGSSDQVRSSEAVVLVGGERPFAESCADLFGSFAREWIYLGPCGSGATMKLVVNLVLGLNRAALAEGLALARACGLDLDLTLRVLQAGAAYSRVMDSKGRKMIEGDFRPQARLSQHLKDVRLILSLAQSVGARTPLSTVHRELLERAEAAGRGADDNSAIIQAFDRDCR